MTNPKVSVLMPVRNCSRTVEVAVRSILRQTMGDLEIILVDDASTDDTADRCGSIADTRIRLVRERECRGITDRLNQLIDLARGRYVARMDGDDVAFPDRFERQLELLASAKVPTLVGSAVLVIDRDDHPLGVGGRGVERRFRWMPSHLAHPTWMGTRDLFQRVRYRPYRRCEDRDFLLRLPKEARLACVPDPLLAYRIADFALRARLRGRRSYMMALARQAIEGKDPAMLLGIPWQVVGGITDVVAGRRRAVAALDPAPQALLERWQWLRQSLPAESPAIAPTST